MPRAKAPPRVKGPYSERGGSRFRIRICELAGHHDLYFSTMKEALAARKEAGCEFPRSGHERDLGRVLDLYIEEKVKRRVLLVLALRLPLILLANRTNRRR